jgi:hypothetical protein
MSARVVELVARETACEHPDKACHGGSCPLAKGFLRQAGTCSQRGIQGGVVDTRRRSARWHSGTRSALTT